MNLLKTDCEYLKTIAVLHDTIEDSDFTLVDLKNFGFPSRVLRAVDLLSKVEGQTNQEYLYAICSNKDAMLVKLADLEHNSKISRQPNLERKDFDRLEKYFSMYRYIKTKLENA
jgi:(p)ppGpp synthase/HD superfamily hydrolase